MIYLGLYYLLTSLSVMSRSRGPAGRRCGRWISSSSLGKSCVIGDCSDHRMVGSHCKFVHHRSVASGPGAQSPTSRRRRSYPPFAVDQRQKGTFRGISAVSGARDRKYFDRQFSPVVDAAFEGPETLIDGNQLNDLRPGVH